MPWRWGGGPALHNHLDDQLVKSNMRDWKTFMGGFSASSKFQDTILQSLDSRPPVLPALHCLKGKAGASTQGGGGPGRAQGGSGGPGRERSEPRVR